jgi:uncharacterized protein YcbK (DUF882 family)
LGVLGTALPRASAALVGRRERSLAFEHLHTGERLRCVYWEDGAYVPTALAEIDRHLRDHRSGEVAPIDPGLLDTLHALHRRLGSDTHFQIVSGYRSPATNAAMRAEGRGVARKSFHMRGMAVDVALPGRDVAELHRAALALGAGGVGYYPSPGFVHVDVGPVRRW